MRPTKLKATICAISLAGALAFAGSAAAALIPIAIFPFNTADEMGSFTQVSEGKCSQKLRKNQAMGINVGDGASKCVYRTSVVADSSDTNPSQDIQAAVGWEAKTPRPLQSKLYLSLLVRAGPTSGYELRVIPKKQRWMVLRDPEGPAPEAVLKAGVAKFIRPKATKRNILRLRATGSGDSVGLIASINGKTVFGTTESVSTGAPAGRFMQIGVGNKTGAAGTGILGTFDDVTIRIQA